ncbi:MAG: STAS domain-containing protein [Planctomycetota bacterium]|jgi:anti-sigma B factor antagonist
MSDTVTSIEKQEELVVAIVQHDELDDQQIAAMQGEVLAAAEQSPGLPVVLDLAKVSFLPSLSLGAVVVLLNTLKKKGQKLILVGMQSTVRDAFAMTRLDKLFEIRDDLDSVVAQLRREDACADE